jgi:hypothetical protein
MNPKTLLTALATLVGSASIGNSTVIGFGNLGGNNTTVPGGLASNATADGNGFVVSNGTTPNIAVAWDANWDIHTSVRFTGLEDLSVGGGSWDNEGSVPRIGQLDFGTHTIGFTVDTGFALVLNSFDFGHTAETTGTTTWDFILRDSSNSIVWSSVGQVFDNTGTGANVGVLSTFAPNFTGTDGGDYVLTFNRTAETYVSNGRHGIDNFSFNQVSVPEPGAASLLGVMGSLLLLRRRI